MANSVVCCGMFFISPRKRTFVLPNSRLINPNGCSTLARILVFAIHPRDQTLLPVLLTTCLAALQLTKSFCGLDTQDACPRRCNTHGQMRKFPLRAVADRSASSPLHSQSCRPGYALTLLGISADMVCHPEEIMISLLHLMHFGIAFADLVLGRTRCMNDRRIDHRALT